MSVHDLTSHQFKPSAGRAESREVFVARAVTGPAEPYGDRDEAEPLAHIEAVALGWDRTVTRFAEPAEFWSWIDNRRRRTPQATMNLKPALVMLGDPNRDLALIGWPEGYVWPWRTTTVHYGPDGEPVGREGYPQTPVAPEGSHLFIAQVMHPDRPKTGRVDVIGIGNLHPAGRYAYELTTSQMCEWADGWLRVIAENGLGPRVCHTHGQQAMRSLLAHLARTGEAPPRHHAYEPLYRFEYEAKASCAPFRLCRNGHWDRLYHTDFTAFYLHVMATRPMPAYPTGYWAEADGPTLRTLASYLDGGALAIARVLLGDGSETLLATPQLRSRWGEIDDVIEMATYAPTEALADWARHLYEVREAAPEGPVRQTVKAVGVALWGKLGQRNYALTVLDGDLPAEWSPRQRQMEADALAYVQPGDWHELAAGRITRMIRREMPIPTDEVQVTELGADGRKLRPDHVAFHAGEVLGSDSRTVYLWQDFARPLPKRSHAIAAHVLAWGRAEMDRFIADLPGGTDDIVYAHTDSLWTTSPPANTARTGLALGALRTVIERDVRFADQTRWIGGRLDAAPGVAKIGGRHYRPWDGPEATTTGKAVFARMVPSGHYDESDFGA